MFGGQCTRSKGKHTEIGDLGSRADEEKRRSNIYHGNLTTNPRIIPDIQIPQKWIDEESSEPFQVHFMLISLHLSGELENVSNKL